MADEEGLAELAKNILSLFIFAINDFFKFCGMTKNGRIHSHITDC